MAEQFILIGHPVSHSVSPVIHHAAYRELGVDAVYRLSDCPDEAAVRDQVESIRAGVLRGANVTVPWKKVAYDLADEVHRSALEVGVANVLCRTPQGKIKAYNTDAMALAEELQLCAHALTVSPAVESGALVLGNGGAARAAVVACRLAGISKIAVTARRFEAEKGRESWQNAQEFQQLGAQTLPWPSRDREEFDAFLKDACWIIQATSAGMKGAAPGDELARLIPWDRLQQVVAYDLVYNPPVTPFLEQASRSDHVVENGLGMLVGQAALAIEIWLGRLPSRALLLSAARKALEL